MSSLLTRLVSKGLQQSKCSPSAAISVVGSLHSNQLTFAQSMSSTASGSTDNLVVEHDAKNKKFFIKLGEAEAKLEYAEEKQKNGGTILDMWHTEVPPQLQGKGIAKILAKEAFEYVVNNNMKMHLTCSYLQKYLTDNPLEKYKAAAV